jgi:hypothetical protein
MNMRSCFRHLPPFVRRITTLAAFAAVAVFACTASAAVPSVTWWQVGTTSPKLMNNSQGYCWLAGVDGAMDQTSDTVNLTFDANWNWVFTGSVASGESLSAEAMCEPWGSLTNGAGANAYFGFRIGNGGVYNISPPPESLCGIEGVGGILTPTAGVDVNGAGNMVDNSRPNPSTLWGQCAHLGPNQTPTFHGATASAGQTISLGSATTQMCVLTIIVADGGDNPLVGYMYIDSSNNYELSAAFMTSGQVTATCIHIPQP